MGALLEIANLSASFGQFRVLKDINIIVKASELVSIVGANGAGKSTMLNIISGLIEPRDGRIIYDQKDIENWSPHKRAQLGIIQVPEGRKLFSQMTVYENLLVASVNHKKERQKNFDFIYTLFPILRERKNQIADTLSGGERQMVAIARGIMAEPKILMLDEPSLGLAPVVVKEIYSVIKKLNENGLTVLLVEQNVKVALKLSSYAYVFVNGKVSLAGSGNDLINNENIKKAFLGI